MWDEAALTARLRDSVAQRKAPAASVAVFANGVVYAASHGVLNVEADLTATNDSLFAVGSVTKPMTATLVHILAERQAFQIDDCIARHVPEVLSAPWADKVTIRQLLAHTSGLDGDFFIDTGDGADCLARYAVRCADLPLLCAPGEAYSYCNAGYSLLARLCEHATGVTWDEALHRHLLAPLGMTCTETLPERAVTRRVAIGHLREEATGALALAPYYKLPRALGPAGFTLMSCPSDLITFARLLLSGGKAADGTRIMSEASVAAMTRGEITLPDGAQWSLGWKLQDWGGGRTISHDGGVAGLIANLWIAPEHGIIYAQCVNGGDASGLQRDLMLPLFARVGLAEPPTPSPHPGPFDLSPYAGTYENIGVKIEISEHSGRLQLVAHQRQYHAPPNILWLTPVNRTDFLLGMGDEVSVITRFADFTSAGAPQRFYAGRQHRRTV